MPVKYKNNAVSTLGSDLYIWDSQIFLASGTGQLFPTASGVDFFYVTIDDGANIEIVKVTSRDGDVLTVDRGVDGTSPPYMFASGTAVELRITAALLDEIKRFPLVNDPNNVSPNDGATDVSSLQLQMSNFSTKYNNILQNAYEYQIATDLTFANVVWSSYYWSSMVDVDTTNFLPNTTYYWRARTVGNDHGNNYATVYSNWTNPWSFTTAAPAAPIGDNVFNISFDGNYYNTASSVQLSAFVGSAQYVASPRGQAIQCSGFKMRLPTMTTLTLGTGDFTIQFWMKADTNQPSWAKIMDTSTSNSGMGIGVGNEYVWNFGRISFQFAPGYTFGSSTQITDNTWHHVAIVRSGDNGYIFIDGVQEATRTGVSGVEVSLSGGLLGGSNYGGGYGGDNLFNGYLDNFKVDKLALYTTNFTPV